MVKASPELIAGLIAAVRAHFPEPDLLASLSEPGALDDVSDLWITSSTRAFHDLPEQRQSVLRAYEATSRKLIAQGQPLAPHDAERAGLTEVLRRALLAYHVPAYTAETFVSDETLGPFGNAELRGLIESIDKLREHQRRLLQTLLDMDERAEARALRRAMEDTHRDLRHESLVAAHDLEKRLRDRPPAAPAEEDEGQRDARRKGHEARIADAQARHGEEITQAVHRGEKLPSDDR